MELEKITLNQLKPADYNPRQISFEEFKKLSNNLKEFGLVDPIVVNLNNMHIIGGHQRYAVLVKENPNKTFNLIRLGDIGWVFEDVELTLEDENKEKALNVSLNKISGGWDLNKLSSLLSAIKDSDIDIQLSGFKPYELDLYVEDEIVFDGSVFDFTEQPTRKKIICPHCNHNFFD